MPSPISGYGDTYDKWQRVEEDSEPVKQAAYRYCRDADSVVSGALCDEPNAISDACRAGRTGVDRMLCDDKQLAAAQHLVWETTKDVLKTIFGALVGRVGK